jgi:hypothetical protein
MLSTKNPFSEKNLEIIFKKEDSKLIRPESEKIEYKLNFNFSALPNYARTMCGFANNKGGYLIFGVEDEDYTIRGMTNEQFKEIDPSRITNSLNDHFSIQIFWKKQLVELNQKEIGVIYVKESNQKPIICNTNSGDVLFDGEIYYRYNGKTDRIKHGELNAIIDERIENIKKSYQDMLTKMAKLEPVNSSILDLDKAKIDDEGNVIIIDDKTIEKLKFIEKGEFKEEKGAPAIKIIGEGKTFRTIPVEKEVPKTLSSNDIIFSFLKNKSNYPKIFIKQIDKDTKTVLPIWFFIHKAHSTKFGNIDEVYNFLAEIISHNEEKLLNNINRHSNKGNIIENISTSDIDFEEFKKIANEIANKDEYSQYSINTIKRTLSYNILKDTPNVFLKGNNLLKLTFSEQIDFIFESITHIPKDKINNEIDTYKKLLLVIKNNFNSKIKSDTNYRHVICYLDIIHYKPKVIDL